jgi:hypothetical protein
MPSAAYQVNCTGIDQKTIDKLRKPNVSDNLLKKVQ